MLTVSHFSRNFLQLDWTPPPLPQSNPPPPLLVAAVTVEYQVGCCSRQMKDATEHSLSLHSPGMGGKAGQSTPHRALAVLVRPRQAQQEAGGKVIILGKDEIYRWENLIVPSLVHKLSGFRTPPPPLLSSDKPHLRARAGERTAQDLGRVAPQRMPRRMGAQVLPSHRDTLGRGRGGGGLGPYISVYSCI